MPQRRATFILRLWIADHDGSHGRPIGSDALRGSLQAVDEAETQHFTSLQQLTLMLQMIIEELQRSET